MSSPGNDPHSVQQQYQTSANLNARIRLHAHFSTNSYGWLPWVFDQIEAPAQAQLLEIGCGPATLWGENRVCIPADWQITLTDQSAGMVQQAQTNLATSNQSFRYAQMDAQAVDFADASFDIVIANHMLYHVPDLPRALGEIRRVLKPGGRVYAATNGSGHMRELLALIRDYAPTLDYRGTEINFSLENGAAKLSPWFAPVVLRYYEDGLAVTEADALVDYVFSMGSFTASRLTVDGAQRAVFTAHIQQQMAAQGGVFYIQKSTGLFIGTKAVGETQITPITSVGDIA